jgi:hypothetical protein
MHELHEQAEHAKHDPGMTPITLTMAILAVAVAAVSLMGHRTHTEEVVKQNQASDMWAYYQAKVIRRNTDQTFVDLISVVTSKGSAQTVKLQEKYKSEVKRYKSEADGLQGHARKLEDEVRHTQNRANYYDAGEAFLEIALVITSITLLSGRRKFWYLGVGIATIGMVVVAWGALVLRPPS